MKKILLILVFFAMLAGVWSLTQAKPKIWQQKCVGCGSCAAYCPVQAITLKSGKAIIDSNKCIDCKFCLTTCTYRAVR